MISYKIYSKRISLSNFNVLFIFSNIFLFLYRSGVEHGNLRELALARMKDLNLQCRDVRTREVGIQEIHNKIRPFEVCKA